MFDGWKYEEIEEVERNDDKNIPASKILNCLSSVESKSCEDPSSRRPTIFICSWAISGLISEFNPSLAKKLMTCLPQISQSTQSSMTDKVPCVGHLV